MGFAAAASLAGPLLGAVGGIIGGNAAQDAANTQSQAALQAAQLQSQAQQQALQQQLGIYNQTRSDLSPYLHTGQSALGQLASIFGLGAGGPSAASAQNAMSALQNYPGYQFQLQQGIQGLDRSAASKGLLLSGAQLKDTTAYGQGMAQTAFGSYLSGLQNLSGLGENAGVMTGNQGASTGQGIANTLINGSNNVAQSTLAAGQSAAAGQVAQGNMWSGLLGNTGLQNGLSSSLQGFFSQNPNYGSSAITPGDPNAAFMALQGGQ